MKKFISICLLFSISTLWSASAYGKDFPIKTKTSDGTEVQLNKDGTWEFGIKDSYEKPKKSTKVLKSNKDFIQIWYNPAKWKITKEPLSPAAEFSLMHKTGEGYGIMIIESIKMSRKSLKANALKNAKKAAPDAYISLEKVTKINGVDVLIMNIRGTINKMNFVYHSAYWAGPEGVFQIITYTTNDLFVKYSEDFDNVLAGIIVKSSKK